MTAALAPFEADLDAALAIVDPSARTSVLELLIKEQPRDERGRFTFGDTPADEGGGNGRGGAEAEGGGGAGRSVEEVAGDLYAGRPTTIAPDQVDALMGQLRGGPPVNLELLDVQGPGNENCFTEHMREIPRSEMPQLPETAAGLSAFTDRLSTMGATAELHTGVDPRSLRATQNQLDGAKVGTLYGYIRESGWRSETVMIASREGAVLDGHHRWAAASAARMAGQDFGVNVLQVDMGIDDLLAVADEFSGERRAMEAVLASLRFGEKPTSPPPDPDRPWLWIGGRWWLVVTDTSDGVPAELDLERDVDAGQAKALCGFERDLWTVLAIGDPQVRAAVLDAVVKDQPRDERGRFDFGSDTDTDTGSSGGGRPTARGSLRRAGTTEEVSEVAAAKLSAALGHPVTVDFAGVEPDLAREYAEGLIQAAEQFPNGRLGEVTTYGAAGVHPSHPGDPFGQSMAVTTEGAYDQNADIIAFNADNSAGDVRALGEQTFRTGHNVSGDASSIAVHEYGHVITTHDHGAYRAAVTADFAALQAGTDVRTFVGREVSRYAAANPFELASEAFTDVMVHEDRASPLSQAIFREIVDDYDRNGDRR